MLYVVMPLDIGRQLETARYAFPPHQYSNKYIMFMHIYINFNVNLELR